VDSTQAVVQGLVEGLTEFLPISSTAHLRLVPALLGWPDTGAAFGAVIQLGALVAVILYFARDLLGITVAMVKAPFNAEVRGSLDARLGLYVIVGTIPVGVAGLLLKHQIEGDLRSLWVIACALIGLALVLLWAERSARHTRTLAELRLTDAFIIGCAQAVALMPGASRSGVTLTAALLLGMRRDDAARFSFLLSIPALGAAGVFELGDLRRAIDAHVLSTSHAILGTAVACVSALVAIAWLMRFLRTRSTLIFVGYRIVLGLVLIALLATGHLTAFD